MDRIDFINNIQISPELILSHFEGLMAGYNLIGRANVNSIKTKFDNNSISFDVITGSNENALEIDKYIKCGYFNHINLYGKIFNIISNVSGDNVNIILQ